MPDAFVTTADGTHGITVPLTFATVPSLRSLGLQLIEQSSGSLTFDLRGVEQVDSAGLALLIDWLANARARSRTLHYAAPSPTLLSLARLSDVEALILDHE